MTVLLSKMLSEMIFWLAWIIIPVLWEIIPAFAGFLVLVKKKYAGKKYGPVIKEPEVTIIVPVYNSGGTLEACLRSIYNSDYPHDMLTIFAVDNGSKDNSYEIFLKCQQEFKEIPIWWMKSGQGKSKALNMALFNSKGKYIINIDSDGVIEPSAIRRMVRKFESDPDTQCMTGSILVDPDLVENTEDFFLRLTRRCEFFEYCNAFLAGRNYESEFSSMYTLSGAFSAFRKSAILKTFMYNSETVCEDTHITFQMREMLNYDVTICEDALFFVDPIDDLNKLYTQRQRWQRGELEVSHMFLIDKLKPTAFFHNFMMRVLMYDHTFAFPRAIWYFAIIYMFFINYPLLLIIGSVGILYLLYVFSAFLFFISIRSYLSGFQRLRRYVGSVWYICFLYPFFNLAVFFMRFAGIINSIKTDMSWKTRNLTEEWAAFKEVVKGDFSKISGWIGRARRRINNDAE